MVQTQENLSAYAAGKPAGLGNVFSAGDVIVSRNGGHITEIGAMGGHFGHVMLVTGNAVCVQAGTRKAFELQGVWPEHEKQIWTVPVIESTRGVDGLRETTLLLCPDEMRGAIMVIADLGADDVLCPCDDDIIEVWQSPTHLRDLLNSCPSCAALKQDTFAELKELLGHSNWSAMTAVRAASMSAALDRDMESQKAFDQVQKSWSTEPICTSVAIVFWQILLCNLASTIGGGSYLSTSMAFIQLWMPLYADRSLPGDLCEAMLNAGWIKKVGANHLRVKL